MMEFLLSKLWMIIAGLAVMAAVLASFGSLDDRTAEGDTMNALAATGDVLSEMESCPIGTTVRLSPEIPSGSALRIGNGSVWLVREGNDLMISCSAKVTALENGEVIPFVEALPGQSITATRASVDGTVVTVVQLEKTELSSSTAATNLFVSSSVL